MAKGTTEKMWKRAQLITILLIGIGFGAVILSLFKLQIIQGSDLKGRAMQQSLQTTELTAERGRIFDRTGEKELAYSGKVWTVVLEPAYLQEIDKDQLAGDLARIIDMDYDTVREKLDYTKSYFTYLKRKIDIGMRDEIFDYMETSGITRGIRLLEDFKRYYPYGETGASVLGHVGTDNNGLSGIELQYDAELRGTAGRMINAKNAVGGDMPFQYEQIVNAENGNDLYLTIDETVQSVLDKYVKQGIDQYVVKNGAVAIMMDVNTGAILGLSSQGSYDPNDPFTIYDTEIREQIDALPEEEQSSAYQDAMYKQWRNKAVSDTYYPGSVFKVCVGAMGLDEGVITPDSTFNCVGRAYVEGVEKGIGCWRHSGHGIQTFAQGLCNSCNPYFIHIGQLLGPDTFFKYFEAFGFTEKTGIDLPGESSSIYYTADRLNPAELATESMGQNFGITPVQMITAVSAVANGGYLVTPYVVDRMVDSNGDIVKSASTNHRRQVISEETSKKMSEILAVNVLEGTADSGYVEGYRLAGKTGTSEKMEEMAKNPERGMQYIASYCGYAPADDPQYALLVFFDEPQQEENGGLNGGNAVAGPIFAAIMDELLPYLGVKTQYTEDELKNLDVATPNVTGKTLAEAYEIVEEANLSYKIIGDSDSEDMTVTMQIPQIGTTMPNDGTVFLYTSNFEGDDEVEVPDFKSYSLSDAKYYASLAGIQISTTSSASQQQGFVSAQNIKAGTLVKPGTVVSVTFIDDVITETFQH